MKITDLKPNDVIHIKTKKALKKAIKLLDFTYNHLLREKGDIAIKEGFKNYGLPLGVKLVKATGYNNETYINCARIDFYIRLGYDLVDVMLINNKPSLNNRVKALERKIKVLEKGSDFMQEINNIEVNSDLVANCNDAPVNKELNELPKKWRVEVTESNKEILMNWSGLTTVNPLFIYSNKTWSGNHSINKEYIEISTEDFKRLVLKENVLEVGKWYKGNESLVLYEGESEYDHGYKTFKGYGFTEGEWIGKDSDDEIYNGWTYDSICWELATPVEVSAALINEAKKRGFKQGSKVNSFVSIGKPYVLNSCPIEISTEYYNGKEDMFALRCGGCCIYSNGVWAKIIEPTKEPESIDWSKSNILEYKGHGKPYLVLSNPIGNQYDDKFFGTMIYTSPDYTNLRHGEYDSFDKSNFKLYKGEPITLKND